MRKSCASPWRLFLVWCLALLLPLQGLAAGAGWHCMAEVMSSAAMAAAPASAQPPCHEPVGQVADASEASAESTCSACAACCVAAAMTSQSRWKAEANPGDTGVLTPPARWAGVVEAGLERPPKRLFV